MMLKRALATLSLVTFASGILVAQSSNLKVAHTTHTGATVAAKNPGSGARLIWSNFGPSPTDAYNSTTGYYVLGPDNSVGLPEQWIGVPFTPHVNATVTALQVGVQWESGTNSFTVGIYSDDDGTVGTLLASGAATNSPVFGTCCQTVNVAIPSTSISQGSQYWIVVSSNDTSASDFTGVFVASNLANISGDVGQDGWSSFTTNTPAAAAWGSIQ
ncbi:MAG TPA: hypothetical protein VMD76_00220 [Candidatus Sulfotelmatobacter sp.]|jgi:hypothetical protein|nr:hypothetical protein [Candidatus Sulfotelmatobacter sp.]